MLFLNGLNTLILGLGDSGLAMARWCARCGATVRVWDSRFGVGDGPPQVAALREAVPAASIQSGPLSADTLAGVQLVLKSPGLAPNDARIAPLLAAASQNGIAVLGELDLFARALVDLKIERAYAPHVLAITGTNGKTTTTMLTGLLVERAGRRVSVAGNVGPTMLGTLLDALDREPVVVPLAEAAARAEVPDEEGMERSSPGQADEAADAGAAAETEDDAELVRLTEGEAAETETESDEAPPLVLAAPPPAAPVFEHLPEVWVLELSSFQLHGVQGFEPSAATVLNVTQDHLDWHGTMQAYADDKAKVYGVHGVMVINRDDALVAAMVPVPPVKGTGKGVAKTRAVRTVERRIVRFGLDAPKRPGDFGLVHEGGMAWLVRALELDPTIKRSRRAATEDEPEIHLQRLMPADALRIRGRHNAANALAALALATAIGCPLAPMLHGLREYRGEPHRVEFIGSVGGVEAFDDSKGTNVGATVAALLGLGADKAPAKLVAILGGDGKGQDFAPLVDGVRRHARAVATLGRDAALIEQALSGLGVPIERHDTLQAAVNWSFAQAQPGDAVLLSPACASLDMFRNYAHRAEVFVAAVQELAAERGEALA